MSAETTLLQQGAGGSNSNKGNWVAFKDVAKVVPSAVPSTIVPIQKSTSPKTASRVNLAEKLQNRVLAPGLKTKPADYGYSR